MGWFALPITDKYKNTSNEPTDRALVEDPEHDCKEDGQTAVQQQVVAKLLPLSVEDEKPVNKNEHTRTLTLLSRDAPVSTCPPSTPSSRCVLRATLLDCSGPQSCQ
jgi:hypothetical protein